MQHKYTSTPLQQHTHLQGGEQLLLHAAVQGLAPRDGHQLGEGPRLVDCQLAQHLDHLGTAASAGVNVSGTSCKPCVTGGTVIQHLDHLGTVARAHSGGAVAEHEVHSGGWQEGMQSVNALPYSTLTWWWMNVAM